MLTLLAAGVGDRAIPSEDAAIKRVEPFDVVGIGFGPSNLALAIAMRESGSTRSVHFIEAGDGSWQPGMLLDGSDIQNNPLRDLVTPRNPQSWFTFVNYLKQQGRLFDYLNLGLEYPLRKDFAAYIKWAATHFEDSVAFGERVIRITGDEGRNCWSLTTDRRIVLARSIVIGTGRSPKIPPAFTTRLGVNVFHFSEYLSRAPTLLRTVRRVAVLGASQSAVEILLDLLGRSEGLEVHAIHRSYSMRQKDTSPFSEQVYFPDFVDDYYRSEPDARRTLRDELRPTNYSAADGDVLRRLYQTVYEERLDGRQRFHVHNNRTVERVERSDSEVALTLRDRFSGSTEDLMVDMVVLATGFNDIGDGAGLASLPALLATAPFASDLVEASRLPITRRYRVSTSALPAFLNGLCEASHGLGDAGSFSLLSLRATELLDGIEEALADTRG